MMLGRNYNIFHAGIFCHAHPFIRVKLYGVKLPGHFLIIGNRNFINVHDPFRAAFLLYMAVINPGKPGVNAPMDKHAKPRLAPPMHALIFC